MFNVTMLALAPTGGALDLLPDPDRPSFVADELWVADWHVLGSQGVATEISLTGEVTGPGFVFSYTAERNFTHSWSSSLSH